MEFLGIDEERALIDGVAVCIAAFAAFMTGFLSVYGFGGVTPILILPNVFLIGIIFFHLVVRKGRRFDESMHSFSQKLFNAIGYGFMSYTSYITGLSATRYFIPTNLFLAGVSLAIIAFDLYLLSYRVHM
ncbi:MAG: hypothetical protein ABEJ36_06525 [Candidatus Nanosalina sp.]